MEFLCIQVQLNQTPATFPVMKMPNLLHIKQKGNKVLKILINIKVYKAADLLFARWLDLSSLFFTLLGVHLFNRGCLHKWNFVLERCK
jgi:hypothetical protein